MQQDTHEEPLCVGEDRVAELLSCSVGLIQKMRYRGKGPPWVRLGTARNSRVVYPINGIKAWLAARMQVAS